MSRRTRKGMLVSLTVLAVLAGVAASLAQTVRPLNSTPPPSLGDAPVAPGAPIPLTPPDGALPSWLTEPPTADPAPSAPVLSGPRLPVSPPAGVAPADPAPVAAAKTDAIEPRPEPDPAIPPAHQPGSLPVPSAPAARSGPASIALPPARPAAPAAPVFGAIADTALQGELEQWQKDHLRYSFALRAIQAKEQLCALDQAPEELCKARVNVADTVARAPVDPAPRPFVEPAPAPERAPPYRVMSVAGAGTDIVVTLRNTDLQETRAVRLGGWVDQDYKLVSADYRIAVIRSRKRSYSLPVTAGASWGSGS